MISAFLLAGALVVQGTPPTADQAASDDYIEVGYQELASGQNEAAIARIKQTLAVEAGDPAALINLGAAHARLGNRNTAIDCYRSAIMSESRYDLELANGSWMDSRNAARLALKMLSQGQTLALR